MRINVSEYSNVPFLFIYCAEVSGHIYASIAKKVASERMIAKYRTIWIYKKYVSTCLELFSNFFRKLRKLFLKALMKFDDHFLRESR